MTDVHNDPPLPFGASHWDKLPWELHDMVLVRAGPLTHFLSGRLGDAADLPPATRCAVLVDTLELDWQGDLAVLPDHRLGLEDMMRASTPSMYARLRARFPDPRQQPFLDDVPLRHVWTDLVSLANPVAVGLRCIRNNHAAMLEHLLVRSDPRLLQLADLDAALSVSGNGRALDLAASSGHLDVVQVIHSMGPELALATTRAIDRSAFLGHLHVIQWLHANRSDGCTVKAMNWAAKGGFLDTVRFLHEHRTEGCTTEAMDVAAEHGHLHVVQFLHLHRTEGCTKYAMDAAARNGHLHVVEFLHLHRTEGCTVDAMNDAAEHGLLDVVAFLHTHRREGCQRKAMDRAAAHGHLDVVRYLHEHRTEGCTTYALDMAAREGWVDVVRFLVDHRQEGFTLGAVRGAASAEIVAMLVDGLSDERRAAMIHEARLTKNELLIQRMLGNFAFVG